MGRAALGWPRGFDHKPAMLDPRSLRRNGDGFVAGGVVPMRIAPVVDQPFVAAGKHPNGVGVGLAHVQSLPGDLLPQARGADRLDPEPMPVRIDVGGHLR